MLIQWDTNFEASPSDIDEAKYGASKIRDIKFGVRERMEVEHDFEATGLHLPGKVSCMYAGTTNEINLLLGMSEGAIAFDTDLLAVKRYSNTNGWEIVSQSQATVVTAALNAAWPIGAWFFSGVSTDPATLLGIGTWIRVAEGKMPIGVDVTDTDFNAAGKTGGEKTHLLTVPEMPAHTHGAWRPGGGAVYSPGGGGSAYDVYTIPSTSTGGDTAHNNMPPYISVYIWQRTA